MAEQYVVNRFSFYDRPLQEPLPVRRAYVSEQLRASWNDGRSRLWTPPFDLLPLFLHKLKAEGGSGPLVAPHWPAQP